MAETISTERFRHALDTLFGETVEKVGGIYLEPVTSLFQTLDGVTPAEASRRLSPTGSNIAAHVDHTRLYLWVMEQEFRGQEYGTVDWEQIWRDAHDVTAEEWDTLRQDLRDAYHRMRAVLDATENWEEGYRLEGALGILAHTAYHLGAIRQILFVAR